GEWEAKGAESSTAFSSVDLSDGEWYDYDEKAGEEFVPLNPRPMLQSLVNEDIIVRLKWGQTEYKGQLVSVDSYMNIQLSNTEEFIDGKSTGSLGQVLIR
ncbi:small nuclear ribonucleoprotein F, partial [Blastomyces dermatitidis ATCC 26199]